MHDLAFQIIELTQVHLKKILAHSWTQLLQFLPHMTYVDALKSDSNNSPLSAQNTWINIVSTAIDFLYLSCPCEIIFGTNFHLPFRIHGDDRLGILFWRTWQTSRDQAQRIRTISIVVLRTKPKIPIFTDIKRNIIETSANYFRSHN